MLARTRIYRLYPPTPLEIYSMGAWQMLLKREDLSEIHSYKWRGAFNFISARLEEARRKELTAASAGNHAQGVAKSASVLQVKAHLFMPKSAPRLKVEAAARLGGSMAEIHLAGDSFDEAAEAARAFTLENGCLYVPPYDDLLIMAGQGVAADEMMTSPHRPEIVFIQIGGGGLAAGAASVLRTYDPSIRIIGVEAEGQASMSAAFAAGRPVTLDQADIFCDGTAVKTAGSLTYPLLKTLLDDLLIVSAKEVAAAIEELWRTARVISEPSGAMGLAAARKMAPELTGKNVGVILSGANVDFRRLSHIARKTGDPAGCQFFYQVSLPERPGSLLAFLKTIQPVVLNISYLMIGQTDQDLARPIVGFEGPPEKFGQLEAAMNRGGYEFRDVSARPDLTFRVAPFQPRLFRLPYAAILNFPERPGALTEFLERISSLASICYFNYVHSGEQVGRALAVFSFGSRDLRNKFLEDLKLNGPQFTDLAEDTHAALGL
jgi:threonine dehydratase